MIRKILIFTVLAVAAAASIVLPIWKSDAAQATHIAATDSPANYVSQGATKTLTVNTVNPNSAVPIAVSPRDNGSGGDGVAPFTRTYNNNKQVTLTAPATVGINTFVKWQRNGVDFAFTQTTSVTMDANYTMTAVYFSIPPKTLTVATVNPNSAVHIAVSPRDNRGGGDGVAPFKRIYNHNTQVTLTAPATAGINTFQKWQRNGVDFAFTQATSVTMDADYTLTAVYANTRTLTVASTNPGSDVSITVSPNDTNNQGSGTTGFSRIYNLNTLVTLTAPASAGEHTFQKWQRNGVDWSTNPSTTVTMDADYTMTAVFIGVEGNTARVTRASTKKNSTARANK